MNNQTPLVDWRCLQATLLLFIFCASGLGVNGNLLDSFWDIQARHTSAVGLSQRHSAVCHDCKSSKISIKCITANFAKFRSFFCHWQPGLSGYHILTACPSVLHILRFIESEALTSQCQVRSSHRVWLFLGGQVLCEFCTLYRHVWKDKVIVNVKHSVNF